MKLYQEVIREQNKNQRAGTDASAMFALCAIIERRLDTMKHEQETKGDTE